MKPIIWLGSLLAVIVGVGSSAAIDFELESKLTYCQIISKSKIHKEERLNFFCTLKVKLVNREV